MSQVYPSAQNDLPVAPSSGPVTYAPGYGPPQPGLFSGGPLLAPSAPTPYLLPIGSYPASGHAVPSGPIPVESTAAVQVDSVVHHGSVPGPSSSLLLALGCAVMWFAAWVKAKSS